jgi:hypothetical protein
MCIECVGYEHINDSGYVQLRYLVRALGMASDLKEYIDISIG